MPENTDNLLSIPESLNPENSEEIFLAGENLTTCYRFPRVSIPFKSGKYSNRLSRPRRSKNRAVSIPFKSGKYSNS